MSTNEIEGIEIAHRIILIATGCALFFVAIAYAYACDRL